MWIMIKITPVLRSLSGRVSTDMSDDHSAPLSATVDKRKIQKPNLVGKQVKVRATVAWIPSRLIIADAAIGTVNTP